MLFTNGGFYGGADDRPEPIGDECSVRKAEDESAQLGQGWTLLILTKGGTMLTY